MEKFVLRARYEQRRGQVWELLLFPDLPRASLHKSDARTLAFASAPSAIHWLREVASEFLARACPPIRPAEIGPSSPDVELQPEDGMRLALAFSATHYLVTPAQRRAFKDRLAEQPSEVVLYWFTLCFYGYRQGAARSALRTLLVHEEAEPSRLRAPRAPAPRRFDKNGTASAYDAFRPRRPAPRPRTGEMFPAGVQPPLITEAPA